MVVVWDGVGGGVGRGGGGGVGVCGGGVGGRIDIFLRHLEK